MNLHLVTGYAGSEHVTSSDQGAFHAAMLVKGCYVLNEGNKFAASIVSNNLVKVLDGEIIMQGRYIKLDAGDYAEVPIENGQQDYKRNDLIVVRYTKNAITGIETTAFAVIKGTPSLEDAVDPEYTVCDILNGAMIADFPLYRIALNGLNIQEPVALFDVLDNFDERLKALANEKVDKAAGKGLSANDYSDAEKKKLADHVDNADVHFTEAERIKLAGIATGAQVNVAINNQTPTYTAASANTALTSGEKISVAFGKIAKAISSLISHLADTVSHITSTERTNWNAAYSNKHAHNNKTTLDSITAAYTTEEKSKLAGIAAGANAYTHPSGAGNKHIPSGGSSGQILRWSASGTAAWGAESKTTYSEATQSAAGLLSASDKKKLDGIATGANKTTVDTTLNASSYNPISNNVVTNMFNKMFDKAGGTIGDGSSVLPVFFKGDASNEVFASFVNKSDVLLGRIGFQGASPVLIDQNYGYYAFHTEKRYPAGTYSGNGSATARTVNIGGNGNAVLVWTASGYQSMIVTYNGAFGVSSSSFTGMPSANAKFQNGVLTLATNNAALNGSSTTYYYKVIA